MASLTAIVAIIVMLVIAITAPIALIIWQASYDTISSAVPNPPSHISNYWTTLHSMMGTAISWVPAIVIVVAIAAAVFMIFGGHLHSGSAGEEEYSYE